LSSPCGHYRCSLCLFLVHSVSTFLPTFPRRGFAFRAFHESPSLQYYAGSDSCRASPARQVSPVHPIAFWTSNPQPRCAPGQSRAYHLVRPAGPFEPGFARHEEARRYTPPNRVRIPTGCPFASDCSPPRLAATQLPSATCVVISHDTDSHRADNRTTTDALMPALVAGIHVLKHRQEQRRGWPGQARP